MLEEAIETVSDLVDLADRNLTRIFADPWPPIDTRNHATRVVYARQQTSHHTANIRPRRLVRSNPTLQLQAPAGSSPAPKSRPAIQPPANGPITVKRPNSKLRKPARAPGKQTTPPPQLHIVPAPALPRPASAPCTVGSSINVREKGALVRPDAAQPRRTQVLRLDDFRPDLAQCDVLVIAVAEMEICKEIFTGWRAQLKLGDPRKTDKLELSIISTVRKLDIGASAALHASHSLLRNYKSLLRTMERNLSQISRSKSGGSPFSLEISSLATCISAHSRALSNYIRQMQERLRTLVRDIEKTEEGANRRALKRKIWLWISRVFKALAALITAGGAIFSLIYPVGLIETVAIGGASMLSGAVARLCELIQERYNETTFDEILTFLRSHIPESAKAAEIALTSFQACHRILQVELEVRKGRRSGWVSARDAERARGQWAQAEQRLQALSS